MTPCTFLWALLAYAQPTALPTEAGTLELRRPLNRTLQPGQSEVFQVAVKAGEFMHVIVEQQRLDMTLSIVDPNGHEAVSTHNHNASFGFAHTSIIAGETGTYRVKAVSSEVRRVGAYRIELLAKRRPTRKDRVRLESEELLRAAIADDAAGKEKQKQAIEEYEKAVSLWREISDPYDEALALERIARIHANREEESLAQDHYRRALDAYQRELRIQSRARVRFAEASLIERIAEAYASLDQRQKAIAAYVQALAVWRASGDRAGEAGALHMLAVGYKYVGEKQKSLDTYQQSLDIRRSMKDRFMEAVVLNNMANVYLDMSRYREALNCFEQTLKTWRDLRDQAKELDALVSIGLIYYNLGDSKQALAYYQQVLPMRQKSAALLINMGLAYSALDEPAKALDSYQQAIAAGVSRYGKATALLNSGICYRNLGQPVKALDSLGQSLTIYRSIEERHGEALALLHIGYTYAAQSNPAKALENYGQALPVWREFSDRALEAETLNNLGELFASSEPDLAILFGKQAVNIIQTIRRDNQGMGQAIRSKYDKSVESYYRTLADLLIKRNRFGEAEEVLNLLKDKEAADRIQRDSVSDSLRSATLLDFEQQALARYEEIVGNIVVLGQRKSALVAKKERSLTPTEQAESQRLDRDLEAANLVFGRFFEEQSKAFSNNSSLASRVTEIKEAEGLQDSLQELGPGVVAIYTLVTPDRYVAMLVTSGARKAYTTPIQESELNRKVFEFRQKLLNPASDPVPLARELYGIVFPPGLRADLDAIQAETIMWSVDSTLRYIPMAALHDGQDYLVRRFRNSLITPASLSRLTQEPPREWEGAGFGVSEGDSPLAAVPQELKAVFRGEGKDTAGAIPGTVRLNADFTRANFQGDLRRKRNNVVHIATHFDSRPGAAANSHLLLGDGEMSLAEIEAQSRLFSGVDLLTLSACNTAFTNRNEDGREVDSFGTIAQRLGAQGVIASLWSVNDPATARLMERMYRLRQEKRIPKGEALRQAQIAMLASEAQPESASADRGVRIDAHHEVLDGTHAAGRWSHPFYWAPFILIGNWK